MLQLSRTNNKYFRYLGLLAVAVLGIVSVIGSGGGSDSSGTTSGIVVTDVSRYAFVVNSTDDSVSSYVVDTASGRLTYIGTAATGNNPVAVAVDPDGEYAYVVNEDDNTVSQYTIAADGNLSPNPDLAGRDVATGTTPRSVAVDPSGRYVYVANFGSNSISQYKIDKIGTVGALIDKADIPSSGIGPDALTVDPNGKYAYVANATSNNVSQYTIDDATGVLAPMTPETVDAGSAPTSVAVDPRGKYVYVANATSNNVSQYLIRTDGALAPRPTATVDAETTPKSVTVDPSGRYVYVSNESSNNVSVFRIDANGSLIGGLAPVPTGDTPSFVVADPGGKYVYVANFVSNTFSQYAIGNSGGLGPIAPAEVATRPGPSAIAMTGGTVAVQAVAKFAYVANELSDDVSGYEINATTGELAAIAGSPFTAGDGPHSVAVDPTGKYAYVANFNSDGTVANGISQYTVGADGVLTAMAPAAVQTGNNPRAVVVDPSGRYVYVANRFDGTVSQYAIDSTSGGLSPIAAAIGAGTDPTSVAVHPSGQYVYVANVNTNNLSFYSIGGNGALTLEGTVSNVDDLNGSVAPFFIAVDPSGRYAYVANEAVDSISQYSIGASGGLTFVTSLLVTPSSVDPTSISVDPTGKFAYVAGKGDVIGRYLIGATGELTDGTGRTSTGEPRDVTVDSSGKYVYVANYLGDDVSAWGINASTGALTQIVCGVPAVCNGNDFVAGDGPHSVTTTATRQ